MAVERIVPAIEKYKHKFLQYRMCSKVYGWIKQAAIIFKKWNEIDGQA